MVQSAKGVKQQPKQGVWSGLMPSAKTIGGAIGGGAGRALGHKYAGTAGSYALERVGKEVGERLGQKIGDNAESIQNMANSGIRMAKNVLQGGG